MMWNAIKKIVAWCFISFGILAYAITADRMLSAETDSPVFDVVFASLSLALGIMILRTIKKADAVAIAQLAPLSQAQFDTALLKAVEARGGLVSVAQATADTDFSFDAVKKRLEEMVTAGVCHIRVSKQGAVVYHFPEFEHGERAELEI